MGPASEPGLYGQRKNRGSERANVELLAAPAGEGRNPVQGD